MRGGEAKGSRGEVVEDSGERHEGEDRSDKWHIRRRKRARAIQKEK